MGKHNDGIVAMLYALASPCIEAAKELDAALAEATAMGMNPEKLHREAENLAKTTTMSATEALGCVSQRCYDAEFWGAADCTNTACPYHGQNGKMKCEAAAGCPGRESEATT